MNEKFQMSLEELREGISEYLVRESDAANNERNSMFLEIKKRIGEIYKELEQIRANEEEARDKIGELGEIVPSIEKNLMQVENDSLEKVKSDINAIIEENMGTEYNDERLAEIRKLVLSKIQEGISERQSSTNSRYKCKNPYYRELKDEIEKCIQMINALDFDGAYEMRRKAFEISEGVEGMEQLENSREENVLNEINEYITKIEKALNEEKSIEMKLPKEVEDNINNLTEDEQKRKMLKKIAQNLIEHKKLITHFGDDLDNKSSVYAIEEWARKMGIIKEDEKLNVERVRAGETRSEGINLDTGGHKGCSFDKETIIIDGGLQDTSTAAALSRLGIYVPEQIVKMADKPSTDVSPLEYRTGLALVRYLDGPNTFKLAEDGKLDQILDDDDLEKYELLEASKKQKAIIDKAVKEIEENGIELPNGEKAVVAGKRILGGSPIAYALGYNYFCSVEGSEGEEDRCTFAIAARPGTKLPISVQQLGERLIEQYKREDGTSDVFMNSQKNMLVAGGPKNPEFGVETSKEEMIELLRDLLQIDDKDFQTKDKKKKEFFIEPPDFSG